MSISKNMVFWWYGPTADIPHGWQICDGTNDTPNLLNRFVVGAGGTYDVGDSGGGGAHSHPFSSNTHIHLLTFAAPVLATGASFQFMSDARPITGTTNNNGIKPPFYSLIPIMLL